MKKKDLIKGKEYVCNVTGTFGYITGCTHEESHINILMVWDGKDFINERYHNNLHSLISVDTVHSFMEVEDYVSGTIAPEAEKCIQDIENERELERQRRLNPPPENKLPTMHGINKNNLINNCFYLSQVLGGDCIVESDRLFFELKIDEILYHYSDFKTMKNERFPHNGKIYMMLSSSVDIETERIDVTSMYGSGNRCYYILEEIKTFDFGKHIDPDLLLKLSKESTFTNYKTFCPGRTHKTQTYEFGLVDT